MGRWALLIVALSMALGVAGCGSDDSSTQTTSKSVAQTSEPVTSDPSVLKRPKPKVETPTGPAPKQLEERDLIEGTGVEAKNGDLVEINFIGVGYDSGKEFENSWDRKDPLFFRIGAKEVIVGWEQGVEGMKVGGRRELIIPPQLGFKPRPPDGVAPDEALIYVVDLIKAELAPDAPKSRLGNDASEKG